MVYNFSYTTSILESLGVLSSINFSETIWEKYEEFAIPKIKDSTIKLRNTLHFLKDLTPSQAASEANSISLFIPFVAYLKSIIESTDKNESSEFKSVALEFFDIIDFLYANLNEIADIHNSYELSTPVLSNDWDSNEDEHWNNY